MTESKEIAPGITVDRAVGFGKPVVKGTGVDVAFVLERLAAGTSPEDAARKLGLTREGLLAALAYTHEIVADEPRAVLLSETQEIAPGITVDSRVRFGKPVLKGTRVDAATVLGHLAAGDSVEAVSDAYGVSRQGVLDALAYAHGLVARETVSAT